MSVSLLTSIARDEKGSRIARAMEDEGVRVLDASYCLDTTPTVVATRRPDGGAAYDFDVAWRIGDTLPAAVPDLLHIGSYSAFWVDGRDAIAELASWCQRGGSLVTFDPNIRTQLLGDPRAARRRFEQLLKLVDVVKLSDEDADWLYPGHDPAELIPYLSSLGPATVVYTMGPLGSTLSSCGVTVHIAATRVAQVEDTVGAGDSYMATLAFLIGQLGPLDSAFSLRLVGKKCAEAAAFAVTSRGANSPTANELFAG